MTKPFVPADQQARQRIANHLDENLFVEAGAGTGKTTELVARIVSLVSSGTAQMDGLAAITFTEAAAAELRERVRTQLEEEAVNPNRPGEERALCARAAREMSQATIQTLHSFAASILRERPLESGLPPMFDVIDEIESDIRFEETWQAWLDHSLESDSLGPLLQRAMGLGLKMASLRSAAVILHQNYDLISTSLEVPSDPPHQAVKGLLDAEVEISQLVPLARNQSDDPLFSHATRVVDLAQRLRQVEDQVAAMAELARWGKLSSGRGRQSDWDKDPVSGTNGCKILKALLKDLEDARSDELQQLREMLLTSVMESVRGFVVAEATQRKRAGRAEFHDLLVWARDLLRDHSDARAHFQSRFSHILVDEFQDTDPIQAEIAFFLAGDPEDIVSLESQDWREVEIAPGKLFVVGDPKQSIYRFRRADIAALEEVRTLLGQQSVALTQNFRSQRTIIAWVNHVFSQWMDPDGPATQAKYIPMDARWEPPAVTPPLGVHWMGGAIDGNAEQVREQEALAVANLVREVKDKHWQVRDDESGSLRDADYQDICILLPARTGLPALEQFLDKAGVPYRVESQTLVLGTHDVRELLNCLRAIDSPADQVAIVAALRSSAFGCSDVELLQFVDAGGRFDYFRPGAATGAVADSLKALMSYHQRRTWDHPDELIERFIRDRQMLEASFGRARPRERWRRLRFVVERARAFIESGGSSLRSYLDWMERQADEGARTVEVPVPETDEDAVRIMTVHASKGLEFPITVLASLGSSHGRGSGPVLIDRKTGALEVRLGATGGDYFQTGGFDEASALEANADKAERVRLAYVAATRAKDHLVVSLFRQSQKGDDKSYAALLEQFCSSVPGLWEEVTPAVAREPVAPAPPRELSHAEFTERRDAWQERRDAAIKAASRPEAEAVSTISKLAEHETDGDAPSYQTGRGGTNLGRAVHGVLQSIDLATGAGLTETSNAQAAAEGIPDRADEIAGLVRTALESSVVKRAVASGNFHREVFVSIPLGGRLVEGFIDLLFEDADGLVIVDYKTDSITAADVEKAKEAHEVQVGLYTLAAREATGKPVHEAVLLFLRPNAEYQFLDIDALDAKAMEAAGAVYE
jgi:ATP-dependent helicase/nuclease subunit A